MRKQTKILLGIALLIPQSFICMDNFHFYRPPFFGISFGEPRLVEPLLTSLDVLCAAGRARCSRGSCCDSTTPLLSLLGPENMHFLGSNVPGKDPLSQEDVILTELARTAGRDCFGYLTYSGTFKLIETQILLTQNFRHGLFLQIGLPIRNMKLSHVCFTDDTPDSVPCPYADTRTWKNFLSLYDKVLQKYGLYARGFKKTCIGDLSVLIGWGGNFQDFSILDYVDADFKLGIIFPTGKKQNIHEPFDIPSGYNDHLGFSGSCDFSVGLYNWFTCGGYGGAIAFTDKTRNVHMKTDRRQNGFIKLAQGCATIERGTIWFAGAFCKLDHIAEGFSLLAGYTYCAEKNTTLHPANTCCFEPSAVNCDSCLDGWNMHTLHLIADYDFAQPHMRLSPRIGFFANINLGGKRIFKTTMAGCSCGLDITNEF